MWPPPEKITLEILFEAWKDQVLITKALADVDFALELEEDPYDRLLVEGKHEEAEQFWNSEVKKLMKLDKQLDELSDLLSNLD
jgi:hypothetical protein